MLTLASILLVPMAALVGVLRQWRLCLYSLAGLYFLVALIDGLAISWLTGTTLHTIIGPNETLTEAYALALASRTTG